MKTSIFPFHYFNIKAKICQCAFAIFLNDVEKVENFSTFQLYGEKINGTVRFFGQNFSQKGEKFKKPIRPFMKKSSPFHEKVFALS